MRTAAKPGAAARFLRVQALGLLAVMLVIGTSLAVFGGSVQKKVRDPQTQRVTGTVEVNKFLQRTNFDNILKDSSFIAIMAVGATILIVSGGIDLSIGAIYCLAAVAGAMTLRYFGPGGDGAAYPGWGMVLGVGTCVVVGVLCGVVNGLLVVLLRVHPFIITLGTMLTFRGIAFVTTEAQAVTNYTPAFGSTFRATVYDITLLPLILTLAVVITGSIFLRLTVLGRGIFAVGGNETAARYSGLRVGRIKVLAFAIAGLCGGIAGVILLGIYGSADSSTGKAYELDVIAAAVVGGASLSGGRGTALGALLGAVLIRLMSNGLLILDIDQNYTMIILGPLIIAAVVLDRLTAAVGQRRLLGG